MTTYSTDESFAEALFPLDISVGSTATATFSTDLDEASNGYEFRSASWSQARHAYDLSTGVTSVTELNLAKAWFMRACGRLLPFRFRDPQDWTSADDGESDPTSADQIIGVGDGEKVAFGLTKSYLGALREITKPVEETVMIAVDGMEMSEEAEDFVVDYKKGIVTFAIPPEEGAIITAGFCFDVPVRFDADEFVGTWSDVNLMTATLPVIEVRVRRDV